MSELREQLELLEKRVKAPLVGTNAERWPSFTHDQVPVIVEGIKLMATHPLFEYALTEETLGRTARSGFGTTVHDEARKIVAALDEIEAGTFNSANDLTDLFQAVNQIFNLMKKHAAGIRAGEVPLGTYAILRRFEALGAGA